MKNIPALNSRKVIKTFKKFGFAEDRQKGSHLILIHPISRKRVVVPVHPGKVIKKPLLKSIIEEDAGITIKEFLARL